MREKRTHGGTMTDHDESEQRLLRYLRVAAVIVFLGGIVLVVVADTLGRLFIDPTFHSSEIIFATMVGAVGALVGTELLARIPKKGGGQ
jgi:ABC-type enterochelin transport system permease subunit